MPEQLTKHPEVTLDVLRSAGVVCGERAAPQAILTTCPVDRFCKLPGGELCVYGLRDAASMSQITKADWQGLATILPLFSPEPDAAPAAEHGPALQAAFAGVGRACWSASPSASRWRDGDVGAAVNDHAARADPRRRATRDDAFS